MPHLDKLIGMSEDLNLKQKKHVEENIHMVNETTFPK